MSRCVSLAIIIIMKMNPAVDMKLKYCNSDVTSATFLFRRRYDTVLETIITSWCSTLSQFIQNIALHKYVNNI